jgi:ferric-dicitrate binding protein FerR (iron transport regulator)
MEPNHPENELLIKYLLHEVSAEEEAAVTEWMNADVNNRQQFEAFEKLWLLTAAKEKWNDINVDQEWTRFKQNIGQTEGAKLDSAAKEQWQAIDSVKTTSKQRIYKLVVAIAVAASVLLIVSLGWKFLTNNKVENFNTVVVENKLRDSAVAVLRHEINTTGKPKRVQLEDGTVIILEDKSDVSFFEPFEKNSRQVTLRGKANFSVAKDKTRPFTVYSDAIATTVLGTVFDVTSYQQSATITVRLYEGKVVAKSTAAVAKKMKEDVYLSPGYELSYNKANALASVRKFSKTVTVNTAPKEIDITNPDNLNIPKKNGSWYMFNNQPLSQVLNQLKEMYKAEIIYNKKEIQKLYFIGQFNKTDSLEMILDQITKANDLKLSKSNNTFIISK